MNITSLRKGDIILVECQVEAVFSDSGMVMVTTHDCTEGFDAYEDEIIGKPAYYAMTIGKKLIEEEEKILEKCYDRGMKEAWEIANTILNMSATKRVDLFNETSYKKIFSYFTSKRAKERLEKCKEETTKVQVGDEIQSKLGNYLIVTRVDNWDIWHCFQSDGSVITLDKEHQNCWKKTGRNFAEELSNILDVMGKQ